MPAAVLGLRRSASQLSSKFRVQSRSVQKCVPCAASAQPSCHFAQAFTWRMQRKSPLWRRDPSKGTTVFRLDALQVDLKPSATYQEHYREALKHSSEALTLHKPDGKMSDLDLDNVSLPSDDGLAPSGLALRDHPSMAYGTLRLPENDELVTISEVIDVIKRGNGRYHRLSLRFADLGDNRMQKILGQLREASDEKAKERGAATAATDQADYLLSEWIKMIAPLQNAMKAWTTDYRSIRILELGSNGLTSDCLSALSSFLAGNLTLHRLCLKSNAIDNKKGALQDFAKAIGRSAVRSLYLSSNPMSPASLAAFFDSIPANGTTLERLELSNVLSGDNGSNRGHSHQQLMLAANSTCDFVADRQRCRSLRALKLSGNNLGNRGVQTIVSALVGRTRNSDRLMLNSEDAPSTELHGSAFFRAAFQARWQRPNRSLHTLDLFGNVESGWIPADPREVIERMEALRRRYASIPLEDIEVIVSFLKHRAQTKRLRGNVSLECEAPMEVARHLAAIDVSLDEWESDFQEASELGAGIYTSSWRTLMEGFLESNLQNSLACRAAALVVLRAARTLGCKARRQSDERNTVASEGDRSSSGFPRFLDLPPEIRLHVLRQLDDEQILTGRQFGNVISFACDPSTIGYGSRQYDWSRIQKSASAPVGNDVDANNPSLPARPWSWVECFELRAPPRNWAADALDIDDDYGGYKDPFLFYQEHSATMFAFLESTLTHRADLD